MKSPWRTLWMTLLLSFIAGAGVKAAPAAFRDQPATISLTGLRHEHLIPYGPAGTHQKMDFYAPLQGGKGPAILLMVSGGWVSTEGTLEAFLPIIDTMARQWGYSVFAVMHDPQPGCVVGEIVPEVRRAVRYIRTHAKHYDIDPDRLGVIGFSSGGHLSLMLGVGGDDGNPRAADPIERASSRVQAVVAFYPPTDFLDYGTSGSLNLGAGVLAPYRRAFFHDEKPHGDEKAYARSISPLYAVTPDDAPTLLIHGDKDPLVPIQQSELMRAKLNQAAVACRLRVKKDRGHGWLDSDADLRAARAWFDRYLGALRERASSANPREGGVLQTPRRIRGQCQR